MKEVYIIMLRRGNFLLIGGSIRFYLSRKEAERKNKNNPDNIIVSVKMDDLAALIKKQTK